MMLPIETERLLLRRFNLNDIRDIQHFSADPNISQHLNGFPGKTVEEIRNYITEQNCTEPGTFGKCFDLAVQHKAENKVIGLATLITREYRQGEIGFALDVAYQRQGFATEAICAVIDYSFFALDLHRIYSKTDRHNISSWLLLERVGMRREGVYLHDHMENGEWHDTFVYAILAQEWGERQNNHL